MIYSVIQCSAAIGVLIVVVFIRKRREAFMILTPLLLLIGNICNATACYMMLNAEQDWDDLPVYHEETTIMFAINNFTLMMSH